MERDISTKVLVSPSLTVPMAARKLPFYLQDSAVSPSQTGEGYIGMDNFSMNSRLKLKDPKFERMEIVNQSWISMEDVDDSCELRQLPDLLSLEPVPLAVELSPLPLLVSGDIIPFIESSNRRFRSFPYCSPPPPPPLLFDQERVRMTVRHAAPNHKKPRVPSGEIARQRRRKISDRTRILESLMPWETRMSTGSMLEEAHKYIKFLEAQVTALQTMPVFSSGFELPVPIQYRGRSAGVLDRLNRQQLLRVMVNSPRVQDWLYKRGLCVFSAEQVAVLRMKAAEERAGVMLLIGE